MLTSHSHYQSQYFAWLLSRQVGSNDSDLLASTLVDAQVDLNPHQVDAALFAFRSPLSKGVILADEVGLGKTIEAGLVIAQRWAERKRRILIIVPAKLRKQWHQQLQDKFSLVINYDLPWNPQRIEQRIGRCYRYGQRHDVVVVTIPHTDNAEKLLHLLGEVLQEPPATTPPAARKTRWLPWSATASSPSAPATSATSKPRRKSWTAGPTTSSSAWKTRSRSWSASSRTCGAPPGWRLRWTKSCIGRSASAKCKSGAERCDGKCSNGRRRSQLIAELEGLMSKKIDTQPVFVVQWELIRLGWPAPPCILRLADVSQEYPA